MKHKYYLLLKKYNLPDVLLFIDELSYSQKILIIQNLIKKYLDHIVVKALLKYKIEHIDKNRVNIKDIKLTLIKFCGIFNKIQGEIK